VETQKLHLHMKQGCQMVCFQIKNPNLGKFWRAFVNIGIFYDHLEYFIAIWYNFWPFGIVYGQLVYFPQFVCLDQDKSGNPAMKVLMKLEELMPTGSSSLIFLEVQINNGCAKSGHFQRISFFSQTNHCPYVDLYIFSWVRFQNLCPNLL
jgi:hypothetical protein